jgi:signal transduction histidine kinase/CheY-like chemotaxis protein/sensor domain CHASE-containing protein
VPNSVDLVGDEPQTNAGKDKSLNRVWLASCLGLAISLTLFLLLARQEERRDNAEFHRQIATYLGTLQEHRNGSEDLLRTLRALFFQNPKLGRQLFTNAVQDLAIRMDGMQAIGWAPRVTAAARAGFEQAARQEGLAGFQIVEGDLTHQPSEKPTPATQRPEYFPLLFIEPLAGNELTLGYDLASHPSVQNLLLRTHEVGGAEVSGPLHLPYNQTVKTGVLAAMPVYFPDFEPASHEDRIRQNQGYVVAVFIIDELMKAIATRTPDLRLDVMLLDATQPGPDTVMGISLQGRILPQDKPPDLARFRGHPHYTQGINIGGRKMIFDFRRSDGWDRGLGRWVPASALFIGLLLTGIVTQAVRSSSEKARHIEAMVHVRTAELARTNAQLKAEVGERIDAQNQLAHERNLLYTLLNRLPDPVHVTDRQGNYVLANDAHARLLEQADPAGFLGKPVRQVGPASLAETLAAGSDNVLLSGKAILGQESTVFLPGDYSLNLELSKLPLRDAHGEIDGLLVIIRDVTHLKRNEAEQREFARRLQETQKLESLGIIAGGIAHDFNNLLTIILGNANIARLKLPPSSNIHECLSRIEATSLRAADLCKQMLAYSGKGLFVIRRIDVSKLVQDTTELLQLSISKKATIQLQLASTLPPVLADATQLQQILMNLVTNASDAIGTRDGVICIRSGIVQADRKSLRDFSPATDIPDGEYVFLEVSDDGCGMPPEVREKIFDPFFSTKFTGRGLGLAAVLGIVRSHRGAITVQSEAGKGSTFRLLLPPSEGSVDKVVRPVEPNSTWKGQGAILLAEDEEAVRITTADLLRSGGFSVDVAENGRSAVDKFRAAPDRYQAVLLDLTMPNGDGEEAFLEIRQIRPHAMVLIMSGFSPQHVLDRFKGKGLNGFIQKPFQAKDLIDALRKIIEIPPGASA